MQTDNALAMLEAYGYRFTVDGERVRVQPPAGTPPPEAVTLLNALRENRPAVISVLHRRATEFIQISHADGDEREITFASDKDMKRWAVALDAGLIQLVGKVQVSKKSGLLRLRYRCTIPDEWLQEAITSAAQRQYNALLERIHKADAWLRENEHDPRYEHSYAAFMKLFEDLRQLYNAIGDPPDDPMTGFEEVAAQ